MGYYAFARLLLIEHRLDFTRDWLASQPEFSDEPGGCEWANRAAGQYTETRHLNNHFAVGPAILWFPALLAVHMRACWLYDPPGWEHCGSTGVSRPYLSERWDWPRRLYGFLALFITRSGWHGSMWASNGRFLATLGIWLASSLAGLHVPESFVGARPFGIQRWRFSCGIGCARVAAAARGRNGSFSGAIGGLMMDVYYVSGVLLLLPLLESLGGYWKALQGTPREPIVRLFLKNVVFVTTLFALFVPTLVSKKIIYGSYLNFGYRERWFWRSPAFFRASFSADHGLFSWTPILILAVMGLFILRRRERMLAWYLIALFAAYLYAIGCYQNWDGLSSFGNRFFVPLTSVFVLGLAAFFDGLECAWNEQRASIVSVSATAVFILWNMGLIFQWGMHLIPSRGAISWRDAAYNQFAVVPADASQAVRNYLTHRSQMMNRIEQEDVNQLKTRGRE